MTTLLIIEDSTAQREELVRIVSESGLFDEILTAADGTQGLRMLLEGHPDVVLCDLEMPGLNGDKLLHVGSIREEIADVPFIFVTGNQDPQEAFNLLQYGAGDVITKPYNAYDLIARLRLHLKVKQLGEQLRSQSVNLERLSTTDTLTGLRTRRMADGAIAMEMERARRHGVPLAILLAEPDDFKSLEEAHGQALCDSALKRAAELLRRAVRTTDVVARYGGGELMAILPMTNGTGGHVVAERWRMNLERESFPVEGGSDVAVTACVGVAEFHLEIESLEQFVAAAHRALERAKQGGGNCVEIETYDSD